MIRPALMGIKSSTSTAHSRGAPLSRRQNTIGRVRTGSQERKRRPRLECHRGETVEPLSREISNERTASAAFARSGV
jgi:hypothetical protein